MLSVRNLLTYIGFAIWVSICAAAPEFIWQGLVSLASHFTLPNVYAIILIGMILTVFVEPILERARDGRWTSEHRSTRSLLWTAPIAFTFGVVAVGLHECMTAYLEAVRHQGVAPEQAVARGFALILEWAWIPFAVTLAWFAAHLQRRARLGAAIAAALWVVAVGCFYRWPWRDVLMTSVPCIAMIVLGQAYVARNWNESTFRNLAIGMAGFIAAWLAATLLLQKLLSSSGVESFHLYQPGDFGDDFRFYLGWAIGLAIAPNPVPAEARGRNH